MTEIKWITEVVEINLLKPHPNNPRTNSKEQYNTLLDSIRECGYYNPIICDHDYTILGGHHRLRALKKLIREGFPHFKKIEIRRSIEKLPDEIATRILVADNLSHGNFDVDILASLCDVEQLLRYGFTDQILKDMPKHESSVAGLCAPDDVPLPPKEPNTKLGDLYQLGDHRLLCGDSTDIVAVERLLAGEKAGMVYCDPPYGMGLDTDYSKIKGSKKSPNAKGYKWKKVIGDDENFDPSKIIDFFKDCQEQFWWGADYFFECLPRGGSLIVWQKRDKADAEMIGNDFEICWLKQKHKKVTFWKRWVGYDSVERGESRVHPTQKPIDLHCWIFEKFGNSGDIVIDLFGGSGSTLIACEKTQRHCRMMELDPAYCDVIITRWEKYTGKKAVKVET